MCTEKLPPTELELGQGGGEGFSQVLRRTSGIPPARGWTSCKCLFTTLFLWKQELLKTFQLLKETTRTCHVNGTSLNDEITVQNKDSKIVKF